MARLARVIGPNENRNRPLRAERNERLAMSLAGRSDHTGNTPQPQPLRIILTHLGIGAEGLVVSYV